MSQFAAQYADVLHKNANFPIAVTDNDHVVAAAGISKREVMERRVSKELENLMGKRAIHIANKDIKPMSAIEGFDRNAMVAYPIIYGGDVAGSVLLLTDDENLLPDETAIKLIQVAAAFLGQQMG